MAITIEAKNYRCLRETKWSPSGVCALVGPNGSGKTTLLRLFKLLQDILEQGVVNALSLQGGTWGLRTFDTAETEPVTVAATVGDLRWELCLLSGTIFDDRLDEQLVRGGEVIFRRLPLTNRIIIGGEETDAPHIRTGLWIMTEDVRLTDVLLGSRVYTHYDLHGLRRQGSQHSQDTRLSPDGGNAFTVLRNWRDRNKDKAKYEFVLEHLRSAFPEVSGDIEFEPTSTINMLRVLTPGSRHAVPVTFVPNGWLTGLLHLCAVAGGEPGSIVAIDEMENALHPYAIRKLLEAFRDWSMRHDLTVCLATHSPVVLNQFKGEPESVFVMEPGAAEKPVPLDKLHDPEWLIQFSLGDLYAHGEFGGQHPQRTPAGATKAP
jgi:predicted ATPase